MKKTLVLLPFLLFITSLTFAQSTGINEESFTLGSPYQVVNGSKKLYFYKEGGILTIKIDGKKFTLQKLKTKSLSLISSNTYEDLPKEFYLEKVLEYNDRYYIFFSLWNQKNKKEQLFSREIDFNSGKFIGKGNLVLQAPGKISGASTRNFVNINQRIVDKFDFLTSHDDSKMLIQYRRRPEFKKDSKSHDIIGMNVFDGGMKSVWNKEVTMPYTEEEMDNVDYSVGANGNAYILTRVRSSNAGEVKRKKDEKTETRIELLKIGPSTDSFSVTPVNLENKYATHLWISESGNGYMLGAGFYGGESGFGQFTFKVDEKGLLYEMKTYKIPENIVNQYVTKNPTRKKGKVKPGFLDMKLREIREGRDGSLLLIAEQDYMALITTTYTNKVKQSYSYHLDDILLTRIESEGEVDWIRKLPKRQTGWKPLYAYGGSYEYMFTGNDHYLIFIGNIKDMDLNINKEPAVYQHGQSNFQLTAYIVNDESGAVIRKPILNYRKIKEQEIFQFSPRRMIPISPTAFVFEVYKKKKEDILIKVNLVP